jgi:kinesin family protein 20
VNVNPFDTGYDENSHVMKFSALAREVYISPVPAPIQRFPSLNPAKTQSSQTSSSTLNQSPQRRKVTVSMGSPNKARKQSEAIVEVLEGA